MINYLPEWQVYLLFDLTHDSHLLKKALLLEGLAKGYPLKSNASKFVEQLKSLHDTGILKVDNIIFSRKYINYRQMKLLASTASAGTSHSSDNDSTFGLGDLYGKVQNNEPLTFEELQRLVETHFKHFGSFLRLEIVSANKKRIQKKLADYTNDFINGDIFTPGVPFQPQNYEKQRDLFFEAFKREATEYGHKTSLRLTQIWAREGTQAKGRFWELLCALECEGYIKAIDYGYFGKYEIKSSLPWKLERDEPFVRFEALEKLKHYRPDVGSDLHIKREEIAQTISEADKVLRQFNYSEKPVQQTEPSLVPELSVGQLTSNDGLIRYKGRLVPLSGNMIELCRLFMEKKDGLVTHEDIKDRILPVERRHHQNSNSTVAKYVSKLRTSLKVHCGKNVIISQREEGWILDSSKLK